jgi:hypothetical protein
MKFLININNILHCSRMAKKYDMPQLQRAVGTFARQLKLSDGNISHCMAIAHDSSGMDELKNRCIEFAARRLQRVCNLRYTKLALYICACAPVPRVMAAHIQCCNSRR